MPISSPPLALPEARTIVTPQHLAGRSGVMLPWAERFHRAWFDLLAQLVRSRRVALLDGVVVGPDEPLLREVACWALDEPDRAREVDHPDELADELGGGPRLAARLEAFATIAPRLHRAACDIDDRTIRITAHIALYVAVADELAAVAPFVQVHGGRVVAVRSHPPLLRSSTRAA